MLQVKTLDNNAVKKYKGIAKLQYRYPCIKKIPYAVSHSFFLHRSAAYEHYCQTGDRAVTTFVADIGFELPSYEVMQLGTNREVDNSWKAKFLSPTSGSTARPLQAGA